MSTSPTTWHHDEDLGVHWLVDADLVPDPGWYAAHADPCHMEEHHSGHVEPWGRRWPMTVYLSGSRTCSSVRIQLHETGEHLDVGFVGPTAAQLYRQHRDAGTLLELVTRGLPREVVAAVAARVRVEAWTAVIEASRRALAGVS